MGAHFDDRTGVEGDQRLALLCPQAEAIGVAGGIGKKGGATVSSTSSGLIDG